MPSSGATSDPDPLRPLGAALADALAPLVPLGTELRALDEAAGFVLAEPLIATRPLPPADNSAMDGYAVRAAELADASAARPVRLPVALHVAAGHPPAVPLAPGTAAEIMTGALLPEGADAVVPLEDCRAEGDAVVFTAPARPGAHLRRAGEDVRAGQPVLAAGAALTPGMIALAAAQGRAELRVWRRPTVAVLGTGDEIFELGREAPSWGLYDANGHGLAAALALMGCPVRRLGVVGDDPAALRRAVSAGLAADVLITTAGVSVGAHDHVRTVLAALGGVERCWRVAIKPGKPLAYFLVQGRPVIALPGNPVSALLVFELFARPLLRRLMGCARPFRRPFRARLTEGHRRLSARDQYLRVRLSWEGGALTAALTGAQGSGILTSMADADALACLPRGAGDFGPGDEVWVLPLSDEFLAAPRWELP